MKKYLIFFIGLFIITGCSEKNIKFGINEHLIYQKVLNDVLYYRSYGNETYKQGFYKQTAEAYKKVNFYDGQETYSNEYIKNLENKAKIKGEYYYNLALLAINKNKDKIDAMVFLNKMRCNNPIKAGEKQFKILKEDEKVKSFLLEKEKYVKSAIQNYDKSVKSIGELKKALDELSKYDYFSEVAMEARNIIKNDLSYLVNDTIKIYEKAEYEKARLYFLSLHQVYMNNRTITKYLNLISSKKIIKRPLNVKKNEDLPKEVNEIDISKDLKEAIAFYDNKDLINARKKFKKILSIEPNHKVALVYIKKIDQQLKTLKKLQKSN